MAALNYYLGLKRGDDTNPDNTVAGVASNGTGSDVELRIQIDPGTGATGITKEDVIALQSRCSRKPSSGNRESPRNARPRSTATHRERGKTELRGMSDGR
jgi:hypothetical protein